MLKTTLKSALISAAIAVGISLGISAPASAHDYHGGITFSGKHGQVHIGHGNSYHRAHGFHKRRHYDRPRRHYRKHRHHRSYGHCGPRRALDKAWRMGVNRGHIARIGDRRIVVNGRNRGRFAKVVFARRSTNCHVIGTHGLWRY